MARVLAISSHVVRGHVGLNAGVPALQAFGHEVWALPTVLLASRPGLGRLVRHELPAPDLAAMLAALEEDGCFAAIDAVLTGYFPSLQSVAVAARAIASVKAASPGAIVMVDPILGDAGRLYVAPEIAAAIRDELLPLATIATPNLFELSWLSNVTSPERAHLVQAARNLGPPMVAVTSAAETDAGIATLLVTAKECIERVSPRRAGLPNGAGDLFAGLYLGLLLSNAQPEQALDTALARLDRVLAASVGQSVLQLSALNAP